jgi:hypothetical protein
MTNTDHAATDRRFDPTDVTLHAGTYVVSYSVLLCLMALGSLLFGHDDSTVEGWALLFTIVGGLLLAADFTRPLLRRLVFVMIGMLWAALFVAVVLFALPKHNSEALKVAVAVVTLCVLIPVTRVVLLRSQSAWLAVAEDEANGGGLARWFDRRVGRMVDAVADPILRRRGIVAASVDRQPEVSVEDHQRLQEIVERGAQRLVSVGAILLVFAGMIQARVVFDWNIHHKRRRLECVVQTPAHGAGAARQVLSCDES